MVSKAAVLWPLVLLCIIAVGSFALGSRDARPQRVVASGKVRMVGNSPMNFLVISGEGREWRIEPEEERKLMPFQQQMVTVRAQEYYYDRFFANGTFDGRHYYLKDITIVEPATVDK
ncbi:MAG: hypothetical protein LBI06_03425 [Treponema sp.]|jgi:Cys-tRNA synthase (O-phospho-L-seryl-tRNA:Cys-tRNA synthase)|nr:hypothetical protein [Treponema sp.]